MKKLIFLLLVIIPMTCIGQGEWPRLQIFESGVVIDDSLRLEGFARITDSLLSEGVAMFNDGMYIGDSIDGSYIRKLDSFVISLTDTGFYSYGDFFPLSVLGGDVYLLISDTAAMLDPYLLSADTAAMLTPYALLSEANSAFNSGSGITINGSNNIDLGGALDASTTITGTEVNNLSINFSDAGDRSTKLVFRPADGLSMRAYTGDDYTGDSNYFRVDSNYISMRFHKGNASKYIMMDSTTSGILIADYIDGVGLVAANDYKQGSTLRSYMDKEYIMTHIGNQPVDATIHSPGSAQDGGTIVWNEEDSTWTVRTSVPITEAAHVMVSVQDTILYSNTTVDTLVTLPVNTVIWEILVKIETPFNGSGTDLLDVGLSSDGDKYENDLDMSMAAGFYSLANLADETASTAHVTFQYSDSGADASAGLAYIFIRYVIY